MKWIVKIAGKDNQRIVVRFLPLDEELVFIGQYKQHNLEWQDFSIISHEMKINAETIEKLLFNTYEKMNERLSIYNDIAEGFTLIKLIEIQEDVE